MKNTTNKSKSNLASGLIHLTLNTNVCVTQSESSLQPATYEALKPMLRHHLGQIPGLPGLVVAWKSVLDAHTIAIAKCGVPVILCGLATGPRGAAELWESLQIFNFPTIGNHTLKQPTETPWLAAGLLPESFKLNPVELMLLDGFEACLGLAIIRYNAELN